MSTPCSPGTRRSAARCRGAARRTRTRSWSPRSCSSRPRRARVVPYYERVPGGVPDARRARTAAAGRRARALVRPRLQPPRARPAAGAAAVAEHGWPRDAADLRDAARASALTPPPRSPPSRSASTSWPSTPTSAGSASGPAAPRRFLAGRGADLNQALMELGATVCQARRADCDRCPVKRRLRRGALRRTAHSASLQGAPAPRAFRGNRSLLARAGRRRVARGRGAARRHRSRTGRPGTGWVGGARPDGPVRLPAGRMAAADFDLALEDPRGP